MEKTNPTSYNIYIFKNKISQIRQRKKRVFWLKIVKMEFIGVIGTVQSYLAKWGKRLNFGNGVAEIARKSTMCQGREKIEFR